MNKFITYKRLFVLNILLVSTSAIYDQDTLQNCKLDKIDQLRMQTLDKYIFVILAPIALFCTLFITLTFICFPKTRKMPGDIIFCISLCECILTIHWFISALWELQIDDGPLSEGEFCQLNAFFSIMGGTGEFIYNLAFCVYLRITLTQILKVNLKIRILLHSISLLIIISVPTFYYVTDFTGLNLFGTCSFKINSSFPFTGLLLVSAYVFFSIYTICFFKNAVPNNESLLTKKRDFMKYYINYVIASCIIWTTLAFSNFMAGMNCLYFQWPKLNIFITLGTIAQISSPIILSILRYQDPTIKSKISYLYSKIFRRKISHYTASSFNNENWLGQITQNIKYLQVVSILTGVRNAYQNIILNKDEPNSSDSNASELIEPIGHCNIQNNSQLLQSQLNTSNQELASQILSTIDSTIFNQLQSKFVLTEKDFKQQTVVYIDGQDMLPMKMTTYCPQIFKILTEKDILMVDPIISLDPLKNQEQLKSFQNPEGGKSGEFFFFTNDNKLILKTMSDQELQAFLKRLPSYLAHITSGDSLLSIIYGLFTFERQDSPGHPKINVYLMRNISQCSGKYRTRVFDLKGSQFAREVLRKNSTQDLSKEVLKDVDFFRTEGSLKISQDLCVVVKATLIRDVDFLKKMRLMDYSLLVMKINWKLFLEEHTSQNQDSVSKQFSDIINIIPSDGEDGIFYHISIIDYLQEWTTQKVIEKNTKKIMNASVRLDTSAQNPELYGERFKNKLVQKIFQDSQSN